MITNVDPTSARDLLTKMRCIIVYVVDEMSSGERIAWRHARQSLSKMGLLRRLAWIREA
jgi:hypothetical protein